IENQQRISAVDNQAIVNRIGSHRCNAADLGIGSAENSLWCDVSISISSKDEHAVLRDGRPVYSGSSGADRQQDLVIHRIDVYLVIAALGGAQYLRVWSLNNADRSFFSTCSTAENQDRLCEWTADHDLVMNGIVCKAMHGSADPRFLSF